MPSQSEGTSHSLNSLDLTCLPAQPIGRTSSWPSIMGTPVASRADNGPRPYSTPKLADYLLLEPEGASHGAELEATPAPASLAAVPLQPALAGAGAGATRAAKVSDDGDHQPGLERASAGAAAGGQHPQPGRQGLSASGYGSQHRRSSSAGASSVTATTAAAAEQQGAPAGMPLTRQPGSAVSSGRLQGQKQGGVGGGGASSRGLRKSGSSGGTGSASGRQQAMKRKGYGSMFGCC